LSRFAGAAHQMPEALLVNPYSKDDVSDAIREALEMAKPERLRRWESLIHGVRTDDVMAWRQAFVGALQSGSRAVRTAQDIILA
jgi:trehalose 6-phosphate synthase